jgi:predicted ATPase
MSDTAQQNMLQSIEFFSPPFRKLSNTKIDFADRITVIAGHNGIGKSTILGLVANTFGLTDRAGPVSYFGEPFFANIERIVYLAIEEVTKAKEHPASAPVVRANFRGILVQKRCAMTQRAEWNRARVVPRTVDAVEGDTVGPDAKVPLPLIFLGVKRLASVGEASEKDVVSSTLEMHQEDKELLANFVRSVIVGGQITTEITGQTIKGTGKRTAQPGYENHGALAISMGQDSLGSIATALASFNRLKREQGAEYHGGILIIDELDVGFHPHAIQKLITSLKTYARRLNLQIVATTHSPRLIQAIHSEAVDVERSKDKVIYLVDTRHPRLAEDQSLKAILSDMDLTHVVNPPEKNPPTLGVYFEDAEGAQFCDQLVSAYKRRALGKKNNVKISLIPLGVGGSNLLGLPDKDPLFGERVLIVDADTPISGKAKTRGNALKLPCAKGASGTDRSPENTIKIFLRAVAAASDGPFRNAMLSFDIPNPSSDRIYSTFFGDSSSDSSQRDSSKNWWKTHWEQLQAWGVLREWAKCHAAEVADFVAEFEAAVAVTAQKISPTV